MGIRLSDDACILPSRNTSMPAHTSRTGLSWVSKSGHPAERKPGIYQLSVDDGLGRSAVFHIQRHRAINAEAKIEDITETSLKESIADRTSITLNQKITIQKAIFLLYRRSFIHDLTREYSVRSHRPYIKAAIVILEYQWRMSQET
ncbi:hypothetical protein HYE67_006309 [Fusarium culmorum]|uniref:Uncharacterized protein n=1 Tax=Fusarium culmorum TaxID=5516 RepID=A0A2T4GEB0_FUSCU|nr:hypothetical protein FCULG_00009896 [Fusarium culmorum]QPC64078.1 hypothetical protein HYE67_006309 [Fusarium culmorum]